MKKKVKKIPKYNTGTAFLENPDFYSQTGNFLTQQIENVQQSKQGVTGLGVAKGTLGGAAAGAGIGSMIAPGIGTAIGAGAGALIGGITSAWGSGASVNKDSNSTNIRDVFNPESGIAGLFHDDTDDYLAAQRVVNSNISKTGTEQLRHKYYSQKNIPINPNVNAAEGGIMRRPVDALVSKGELIYNPVTKKLSQVPGSKGKPNKADDVYTRLYEGDVVISNSPTMLMSNGKTPAQNLMGMVDKYATGGTVKAREAIIKKVVNWQEANKTKPQEYAMYAYGTGEEGAQEKPIKKRRNSIWNRLQDKWDKSAVDNWLKNYYENIDKYEDHAIIDGRLFIKHDGNWYDSHDGHLGNRVRGNVLPESGKGYINDRYQTIPFKEGVFANVDKSKIVKQTKPKTSTPSNNVGITTHPEIDFVFDRHKTSDYSVTEVSAASEKKEESTNVTDPKKGTVAKSSSKKDEVPQQNATKLTPEQISESLRIEDIGERHWLRGPINKPNQSLASLARVTLEKIKQHGVNEIAPSTGIKPHDLQTGTDWTTGYTGQNWKDGLYRMAVLSQPLWDRAKAEPVQYTMRNAKYLPVQADPTPLLQAADQSYSIGNYNFANMGGSTGAHMAYGAQLASDRAKRYADAYKWQQDTQNKLIAQNAGIYNDWDKDRVSIMNSVYDKTAANRAAARNINKQNRAAALRNYGQMLRDDKQNAVNMMKFAALNPAIQSTYEDSSANDIYKWYKELFG